MGAPRTDPTPTRPTRNQRGTPNKTKTARAPLSLAFDGDKGYTSIGSASVFRVSRSVEYHGADVHARGGHKKIRQRQFGGGRKINDQHRPGRARKRSKKQGPDDAWGGGPTREE